MRTMRNEISCRVAQVRGPREQVFVRGVQVSLLRRGKAIALVLLAALPLGAQTFPSWVIGPFARPSAGNPVISPNPASTFSDPLAKKPVAWEALHTFNPAAIVRD